MAPAPTRERLVTEAMRLFSTKGFEATSVSQIEAAAGLSPGSGALYRHFESKEALLGTGIDRQLDRRRAMHDIRALFAGLDDLHAERLEPGEQAVQGGLVLNRAMHDRLDRLHRGGEPVKVEQGLGRENACYPDFVIRRHRGPQRLGNTLPGSYRYAYRPGAPHSWRVSSGALRLVFHPSRVGRDGGVTDGLGAT